MTHAMRARNNLVDVYNGRVVAQRQAKFPAAPPRHGFARVLSIFDPSP